MDQDITGAGAGHDRGVDRRDLIRRGAIAAGAAWVAPAIIGSVASPALGATGSEPVPTGIEWFDATAANQNGPIIPTVTCSGPITARTCTSSPAIPNGNTRSYTARVRLVDQFGNPIVNPGAAITVTITQTGGTSGPTPATLSILTGASASAGSTSVGFANGNSQGSLNGSATVNAVAVTASVSTNPP